MLRSLRKKKNIISDKSYIPGEFSYKITCDIDFTYEPVVQCDVPVIKNLFGDDWK